MKIKTIGTLAAAALFTGSLSVVQAEEAKKPAAKPAKREAAKESDRPSRESIIKRFDKDGDGKLSEEERRAAGAARRKLGERQSDRASDSGTRDAGIRRRLEAAGREISEAVKAGKITEEQGRKRMAALKKRVSQGQSREDAGIRRRLEAAGREIREAVKADKITEEQGRERMAALRKRVSQSQSRSGTTRDSDSSRRGGTDYRARLMKEYDKNGDGKLDEKEREAARKALSSRRSQGRGGSERGERSRTGERRERGAQASGRGSNRRGGENTERSRSSDSDRRSDRTTDRRPRGQDGENAERRRRGISVEEYRRGEAQIRELVEKGKVSKEDAEKRLIEMRKTIRTDRATERRPGGQSGENAERRRRGSQRGEGGENRRRGNRRGGE